MVIIEIIHEQMQKLKCALNILLYSVNTLNIKFIIWQ